MNINLTDIFTENLHKLSQSDFDIAIIDEAKKCLLDYFGVTTAGAHYSRTKSSVALNSFGGIKESTTIGLKIKTSISNSILFNGIHSHIMELDDGHRYGMLHPSVPIISALLPLLEQKKISGYDVLRGIILGYEASIRLACALQPSLKIKGYHATGIAGAIGSAVAIVTALRGNRQQLKSAISAATTSASGILKVIKNISELKPYNAGNAALSGYNSAIIGISGFNGPHDIFDGELGFLSMFSDNPKTEFLTSMDLTKPMIFGIYRKPYAACRHCHAPIEAGLILKKTHTFDYKNIQSIEVQTYSLAVDGHDHKKIEGINSAKMSTPYSLAVTLIEGQANIEQFSEQNIVKTDILELTKKINLVSSNELTALVPQKRAAIVTIKLFDGTTLSQKTEYPKGEPENPITNEELKEKYMSLMSFSEKDIKTSMKICDIINNFETYYKELVPLF